MRRFFDWRRQRFGWLVLLTGRPRHWQALLIFVDCASGTVLRRAISYSFCLLLDLTISIFKIINGVRS